METEWSPTGEGVGKSALYYLYTEHSVRNPARLGGRSEDWKNRWMASCARDTCVRAGSSSGLKRLLRVKEGSVEAGLCSVTEKTKVLTTEGIHSFSADATSLTSLLTSAGASVQMGPEPRPRRS